MSEKLAEREGILEAAWNSYREEVIPRDAPHIQLVESRRAFYAGAHAVMNGLAQRMSPGQAWTENDESVVARVTAELTEHLEMVKRAAKDAGHR